MVFVPNSFLLLVVRAGAPSSVLAPSRDALCSYSFLLLVVRHLLLEAMHLFLVASLLLVVDALCY